MTHAPSQEVPQAGYARNATRLSRAYWRLWWAAAADNIGDGAFAAAVPLLAVTITRDPLLISLVGAATYLPWMVLSS